MWPFRKKPRSRNDDALATIDSAIDFVAQRWLAFSGSVPVRPDTPLRDRVALFARSVDASLHQRFPALAAASEQVILMIVAKGIEQSGAVGRRELERELGILLPP
ncbi:hypothetical protein [Rhizorhabdus dicambivorans]|uniref:TetR family transcriptional regulator n=1 Tax=Rhizorhabdus dicambivorans TaxID=1850238 RepID=A0A2A4FR79_9SPHN|nr:hypothetical protein [Rhizorhabdus dicambivorans]ATE64320.1 hypothetical protein CMV14_07855 [Rhizorhabdus dicambivorans]PCE40913.1 hypothetical protein COO09_17935 [Rhizorhabdus dicambivorans]